MIPAADGLLIIDVTVYYIMHIFFSFKIYDVIKTGKNTMCRTI